MNISDEAVEAAVRALFPDLETVSDFSRAVQIPTIRTILEAAAPHLLSPVAQLADELAASTLSGDNYLAGRGSGFRIAGVRIRQVLGLSSAGAGE